MRFIRENNVDESAQDALWKLGPEEQDQILRAGPCTGANPSAVLMSRIRRLAIERAAYAPPLNPGDVDRFLRENEIGEPAAATLEETYRQKEEAARLDEALESATPMQIYQKVTKGIQRVAFPKSAKAMRKPSSRRCAIQIPTKD